MTHNIYWWNLENLFSIEHDTSRSDFLASTLNSELRGWTQAVLDRKLANLLSIITQFNGGLGPDIFGVCEVENEAIVSNLAAMMSSRLGRTYSYKHADSDDKRGIDTALIYDTTKYNVEDEVFTLRIIKRNATRDLLQIHLNTVAGNHLVLVLNHWPSRSGGTFESEPYRIMVAENLAYWVERIHEERGKHTPIVLMGDFNDDPFDRSITTYLMAVNSRQRVLNARNNMFHNLMYQFLDAGVGTYAHGSSQHLLDQFMVSKSIASNSHLYPFKVVSTDILAYDEMVSGDYKKPIRFSRPSSSSYDPDGFSDHLPIELILQERV